MTKRTKRQYEMNKLNIRTCTKKLRKNNFKSIAIYSWGQLYKANSNLKLRPGVSKMDFFFFLKYKNEKYKSEITCFKIPYIDELKKKQVPFSKSLQGICMLIGLPSPSWAVKMKLFAKTVFNSYSNKDPFKDLKAVITKRVHIEIIRLQDLSFLTILLYRPRLKQELAATHLQSVAHSIIPLPKSGYLWLFRTKRVGYNKQHWIPLWVTCSYSQTSEVSAQPFLRLILYTWTRKKETLLWLLCNTNSNSL